jgi:O-methyltransferase
MIRTYLRGLVRRCGFDVIRYPRDRVPIDLAAEDREILTRCRPYTLTTYHRLAAMLEATAYCASSSVPGSIVECGVWLGGSMMVAAMKLVQMDRATRSLYLLDTFEGMPPPSHHDEDYLGTSAARRLAAEKKGTGVWAKASLEEVRANLAQTGYPSHLLNFVKGRVEDTLSANTPEQIAILRLDTDWYESTLAELRALYPKVVTGGLLIIDDYGDWKGARKAVDQYFAETDVKPYLARIDYTCRVLVKGR